MKVLRLSQKKRIEQESVIKLKLTEYAAALFEFLQHATQKPKAELAAEILGAALISDRELRLLFAEHVQGKHNGNTDSTAPSSSPTGAPVAHLFGVMPIAESAPTGPPVLRSPLHPTSVLRSMHERGPSRRCETDVYHQALWPVHWVC